MAGGSRFVEIVGEPGMGKSRLVEVLRARAGRGRNGAQCITIRCEAYESTAPYASFSILLRYLLGVEPANPANVWSAVCASVSKRVRPNCSRSCLCSVRTLDLDIADPSELAELEPAFRRERVDEVTAPFLQRTLADPTVLVFEDVQHMDEPSVGLLRHLGSLAMPSTLLCVTRRPSERGFVARLRR